MRDEEHTYVSAAQTINITRDDGDQRGWHRDSQSWGSGSGEDSAELFAVRSIIIIENSTRTHKFYKKDWHSI